MQDHSPAFWPIFLAAAVLICLVCVVFWPMLGFEFVDLDVDQQVVDNPDIRGLTVDNLKHIFTSRQVLSYYPIRALTFAVDYQLWGLDPSGFKLTNLLVHLGNVLLVFWLILRLFGRPISAGGSLGGKWDLSAATFSAGVFAVHPVVVEPVAWVGGREELLMTLGTLGCIHFHLSARQSSEEVGKSLRTLGYRSGAAICCAIACLSNAVAAVVPLLIVVWDILTLSRPKLGRILCGTSVLWAIGAATIVIKKLGSDSGLVAHQAGVFSAQRLALVLDVYRLNLQTLAWPTQLAIEYPGIPHRSLLDPEVVLGGIAVAVTCGIWWLFRRHKLLLFGLVWFCLTLMPTSQIMPHHVPRADRFLYLPLAGLAISIAIGAGTIPTARKGRVSPAVIAVLGVLSLLGILSAGQVQTWQSSASMWDHCLKVNPQSARAHGGLADALAKAGQLERASEQYAMAIQKDPNNANILKAFALHLATCHQHEFRDYPFAVRLAERACDLTERRDAACLMALAEVHAQAGQSDAAVATVETAIALAESDGDAELTEAIRRRLKLFQSRIPSDWGR